MNIRLMDGIMSYERMVLCDWVLTRHSVKATGSRIFVSTASVGNSAAF
jgi:hypothetical protein